MLIRDVLFVVCYGLVVSTLILPRESFSGEANSERQVSGLQMEVRRAKCEIERLVREDVSDAVETGSASSLTSIVPRLESAGERFVELAAKGLEEGDMEVKRVAFRMAVYTRELTEPLRGLRVCLEDGCAPEREDRLMFSIRGRIRDSMEWSQLCQD